MNGVSGRFDIYTKGIFDKGKVGVIRAAKLAHQIGIRKFEYFSLFGHRLNITIFRTQESFV